MPGEENLIAHYPPFTPEPAADSTIVKVREGSLRFGCGPVLILAHHQAECEAFVPATPGSPHPTGSVKFSSMDFFGTDWKGEVEDECELEPTPEGSGCTVSHTPALPGEYAVLAEYQGDEVYPASKGSSLVRAAEKYFTSSETTCENAKPVIFTLVECTTTVTNVTPIEGAPVGRVSFDDVTEGPVLGTFPGSSFCFVEPVGTSGRESACSVTYRPQVLTPHFIKGVFAGEEFEVSQGLFEISPQPASP